MKKTFFTKNIIKFFYLVLGVLLVELTKIFMVDKLLFFELISFTIPVVGLFELKQKNNYNIIKYKDIVK